MKRRYVWRYMFHLLWSQPIGRFYMVFVPLFIDIQFINVTKTAWRWIPAGIAFVLLITMALMAIGLYNDFTRRLEALSDKHHDDEAG